MPTYDYQCRACGTVTEVIHPMRDDGPSVCELCGGQLRRVIFPSGIIFKGSGFYRNDSRAAAAGSDGGEKSTGAEKVAGSEPGTPTGSGGSTGSTSSDGGSKATKAPSADAGST